MDGNLHALSVEPVFFQHVHASRSVLFASTPLIVHESDTGCREWVSRTKPGSHDKE